MALSRRMQFAEADRIESLLRPIDATVTETTGTSMFHILTFASITAAIVLFMQGKKFESLFVGLWPPTLQALKAASERG